MTLTADRGLNGLVGDRDRRSRTLGPRYSWASMQPFEPRPTAANRLAADPNRRTWDRLALRYVLWALLADVAVATTVATTTLTTMLGVEQDTIAAGVLTGLGFALTTALMRGYDVRSLGGGFGEFQSVVRGGLLLAAALMAVAYTTQIAVPRRLVLGAVPVTIVLACLARYAQRRVLHHRRRRGAAMMRTIVVGDPRQAARVVAEFTTAPYHGYEIVGTCVPEVDGDASALGEVPVLGAVGDVPQVVSDYAIDVVIVAGAVLSGEGLRRLSWALGRVGAELMVAPDLVEVHGPRLSLRPTSSLSLLAVEVEVPRRRLLAKAVLDRALGTVLAVLALPVIGVLALAVRFTSPGPAFYRQTRVGVNGTPFTLLKLRSMYVDADERRDELLEHSDRDGPMFKMRRDPRVTPVGRFLRRFSLDELPQLFNVVKGDMSLVGPRPPLLDEVATYHDAVHRRLHVRPGITGLWQVSGRADLSWEESVRLDLRYVDNWSVSMDAMILWKTARAVLSGTGAY